MDLKEFVRQNEKMNSSLITDWSKDMLLQAMQMYADEQLRLYGVGSSTYKIAITDRFCTYDFEIELPKTTCIRDIARRLYGSFGLKEEQGRLRE